MNCGQLTERMPIGVNSGLNRLWQIRFRGQKIPALIIRG